MLFSPSSNTNFTVVDGAVEAAMGYSFPSGHTATAVSVYGSFITWMNIMLMARMLAIILWWIHMENNIQNTRIYGRMDTYIMITLIGEMKAYMPKIM